MAVSSVSRKAAPTFVVSDDYELEARLPTALADDPETVSDAGTGNLAVLTLPGPRRAR